MYKAHINQQTNEVQTVKQHCENTAKLSERFSVDELKQINRTIGLLHDIGKYQESFQRRINGENIQIEHSICGALEVQNNFSKDALSLMMEYCIAGHHSGIPDGGAVNDQDKSTLYGRLMRKSENYEDYKKELVIEQPDVSCFMRYFTSCKTKNEMAERFAFLTRYCFSCLTDADSIDTADFCDGAKIRSLTANFDNCLQKINYKLSSFSCVTDLQKSRATLQDQVYKSINKQAEIFLMNLPTGSGKTLCSMKFALERAIAKGKKRIIYVIPYNSIIEQTADVFESLFGCDAQILRHQSTFSYDDKNDIDEDYKITAKLATENWDAQIIITTAVQFFESIYANKRGKLRKLHNMADSILIFDEAHMMPVSYLQPCLNAISYITEFLNSEAVFLTATMPDFSKLINMYSLPDIRTVDLVEDKSDFCKFDKCRYTYIKNIPAENLLESANKNPSTLIVVNRRTDAQKLYNMCPGEKYHLSTYMTSYDRKRVIDKIRERIIRLDEDFPDYKDVPEDRRIIVISTSLIEAGVDLDFFTVYRELSGLDSILQAGGRCNREGKRKYADVYIFNLETESYRKLNDERAMITKGLLEEFDNISSAECIKTYYDRLLFLRKDEITKNSISNYTTDVRSLPFKDYAQKFEIIESCTQSIVVVRDEESARMVENLKNVGFADTRKLQKYACSVHRNEFDSLLQQHVIDDFGSGVFCLTNPDYYKADIGIVFEGTDYII
jgi:CRISPR-associated endonuclease/helicase Cas3